MTIPEEKIQQNILASDCFCTDSLSHARNKEKIDLGRVIKMLSIHDVVEIDGDTFFYDEKTNEGKFERELASAERIFGILAEPMKSEFMNLWLEFEVGETETAIFCKCCR